MDVEEAIKIRRTIRRFKDGEVADSVIKELLEACRLSPSGSNKQPTRLFFVRGQNAKNDLFEAGAFAQEFVTQSPLIVIFCGDPAVYGKEQHPSLAGKNGKRCLRDISIASSFVVLRATELGLSSCWVGMIDQEKIKGAIGIDDKYMIPFVICFGYPDQEPAPLDRLPSDDFLIGDE